MTENESSMRKCHRCGRCCLEVGRTFWKVGKFLDCEELNRRATDGDHEDNGLPCEMLTFENGLAVCRIEKEYGYQYKPSVCRDYPEPGEPCFRDQAMP